MEFEDLGNLFPMRSENMTALESEHLEIDMKRNAATALGMMLFEIGELERDLSLSLVWLHGGQKLPELTSEIESLTLDQRIAVFYREVEIAFVDDSPLRQQFQAWLARVDGTRKIRNELVHARWWFDPFTEELVAISGIPTSEKQSEKRIAKDGIWQFVASIGELRRGLHDLRKLL